MSFKKPQSFTPEEFLPNEEEKAKINEIKKMIGPAASKFPCQLSDASVLRFLRAGNANTRRAAKVMKETLKWCQKYRPEMIRWDDIAHEAKTGKLYRVNYFDKYGRIVLVMRPSGQLCGRSDQVLGVLFGGQEQMVRLIDFRRWDMSSISVKVTQETARVLQDHYPERLGIAILYNPPKVFETFWLMVKPFLEPKTYKKVKFVYMDQPQTMKVMEALFEMDKLESGFGGKNKDSFEFESYAKRMKDKDARKLERMRDATDRPVSINIETGLATELKEPGFLRSDVSSELSEGADSSSRCNDRLDYGGKINDGAEVK